MVQPARLPFPAQVLRALSGAEMIHRHGAAHHFAVFRYPYSFGDAFIHGGSSV